ncbi:DUF2637 domain-containing protein [Streptomyces sp. NPDC037389]|uniref:DUF2637 domain-containing protein n=1 Tax=Streptomyces sp. NPDC037389 TaxID=3155369 RepID=UPI0033D781ED
MPKLTLAEWGVLVVVLLGAVTVGVIGLYSSFGNVTAHMRTRGFQHPQLVPAAVDIAIPVFGLAYLVLIRLNMRLGWVRWVPYILTGVTIYLNVTATSDLDAQVAHAALPSLWVAFTEVVAHFYKVNVGIATGTRADPIPFINWILSPFPTFHLWRSMRLQAKTSYKGALENQRQRVRAITALRNVYGRAWRLKAPLDLKTELRLGALTRDQVYNYTPYTPNLTPAPVQQHTLPLSPEPSPDPIMELPADAIPAQRELQNPPTQTALPVGQQVIELPDGDIPQPASEPVLDVVEQSVETRHERSQREQQEQSSRDQQQQDNYDRALAVVLEYVSLGRTVSGARIAEDERVTVGARSVQRYLKRMVVDGIISEDVVEQR